VPWRSSATKKEIKDGIGKKKRKGRICLYQEEKDIVQPRGKGGGTRLNGQKETKNDKKKKKGGVAENEKGDSASYIVVQEEKKGGGVLGPVKRGKNEKKGGL